jgi:organic hydroperoxide reductase OsmC/OhrA
MQKQHHYQTAVRWTGNNGAGTLDYRIYSRDHIISAPGKHEILASSDTAFRGDPTRYNPEEMLLAALASCHMLWYLHLCADAGVVVTAYTDQASGIMTENEYGNGQFTSVMLRPEVQIADESMRERAIQLHEKARNSCFIANSVNFPVHHEPVIQVES